MALCLPRNSCAAWLASRPSTTSVASMTCQSWVTSPGLGLYVRTVLPLRCRPVARVRERVPPSMPAAWPNHRPVDRRRPTWADDPDGAHAHANTAAPSRAAHGCPEYPCGEDKVKSRRPPWPGRRAPPGPGSRPRAFRPGIGLPRRLIGQPPPGVGERRKRRFAEHWGRREDRDLLPDLGLLAPFESAHHVLLQAGQIEPAAGPMQFVSEHRDHGEEGRAE